MPSSSNIAITEGATSSSDKYLRKHCSIFPRAKTARVVGDVAHM